LVTPPSMATMVLLLPWETSSPVIPQVAIQAALPSTSLVSTISKCPCVISAVCIHLILLASGVGNLLSQLPTPPRRTTLQITMLSRTSANMGVIIPSPAYGRKSLHFLVPRLPLSGLAALPFRTFLRRATQASLAWLQSMPMVPSPKVLTSLT
jgi:hypothetical protein